MSDRWFLRALLVASAAIFAAPAAAAPDTGGPMLLIAKPKLSGSAWGSTILIAKPIANGMHIGFIVNRPTQMSLAEAFPEHAPSKKVADPLFLGGPSDLNVVFALVERHAAVRDGALQMAPYLFLAMEEKAVDRIIEKEAEHARFFVGAVIWRPGELEQELSRDMWFVDEPDPELVLSRKTEGLWEELVRRAEARAHMI
jgi:putative transcriptional regulator